MRVVTILPLLTLVTLATSQADAVRALAVSTPWAAAMRTKGLSHYALWDTLDEIPLSPKFWSAVRGIMTTLGQSPDAKRHPREFVLKVGRQAVPPAVPSHIQYRAMAAISAVADLFPSDLSLTAMMDQAGVDFDQAVKSFRARRQDWSTLVVIRRMERRALQGIAAAMVLAADDSIEPALHIELLGIYAAGMENALCRVALDLEGEAAEKADGFIRDLRLEVLDREALRVRAEQLAEAREILASTASELGGEPLRLPPDPAFREAELEGENVADDFEPPTDTVRLAAAFSSLCEDGFLDEILMWTGRERSFLQSSPQVEGMVRALRSITSPKRLVESKLDELFKDLKTGESFVHTESLMALLVALASANPRLLREIAVVFAESKTAELTKLRHFARQFLASSVEET